MPQNRVDNRTPFQKKKVGASKKGSYFIPTANPQNAPDHPSFCRDKLRSVASKNKSTNPSKC